jgi:hypothetical protein
MKTITPGQGLKEGQVGLSAYWNGTPMFSHNMSIEQYNELVLSLKKDFIDPEDVDDMIEHLNQVEQGYFAQCQNGDKGGYVVDLKESMSHLLLINDLVNNKKVIPNDDMFGLLVLTMPKKSSARTGNSNQTPKKKKRK